MVQRIRRFLQEVAPWVFVFLIVGSIGLVVWLSHHPDTPWLAKAEEWPVVGPGAKWLRQTYLPPESVEVAETEEAAGTFKTEVIYLNPDGKPWDGEGPLDLRQPVAPTVTPPRPIGSGSTGENTTPIAAVPHIPPPTPRPKAPAAAYLAQQWTWFLPGNPLRVAPSPAAEVLRPLPALAYLPVLETRGEWASVVMDGQTAWIHTAWQPPFSRNGARRGILRNRYEPVEKTDWEKIRRARKLMDIDKSERKLGAYELYTNVTDGDLLAFLDQAATAAEEAYFARYGRLPSGDPKRSVVLFDTEQNYRRFSEQADLVSSTHVGHAGSGVVAMFVGDRSREDLARTLVHEIAHLLNNRAVAWRLPIWLEEGMASDLGAVWMESAPTEGATSLAGDRSFIPGPEWRLLYLDGLARKGQLPSVDILWRLDRERFYSAGVSEYGYSHSAALITFLIEGDDGRYADAFRDFLKKVAIGQGPSPRLLMKLLDMDPPAIDQAFQAWLQQAARASEQALRQRGVRVSRG